MSGPNNERHSLNGQMRGSRKRASKSSDSTPLGMGSRKSSSGRVPCGACKFLRRRCVNGCIFAPHFGPEQGTTLFAAVHKVFGASNVSKLLVQLPPHLRYHAVQTLSYEAQARLIDPVCGCVSVVLDLIRQVASLQMELAMAHKLIAERFTAANTPQVYSNGSFATNNNMVNMNMFDSTVPNLANDHQYVVYSQPIFGPMLYAGPYFKNEGVAVEAVGGGPLVSDDQMV